MSRNARIARIAAVGAVAVAAIVVASLSGALAAPKPDVVAALPSITPQRIETLIAEQVAIGPRPWSDPAAGEATVAWLEARLAEVGYEPRRETFTANAIPQHNVIAERRGTVEPDVVIELVAHHDTVPGSPGADDNASGVAALLEVARVVAEGPAPERTVRFVFVAMEERGLTGSRVHVASLAGRIGAGDEVLDVALVVDMLGFRSRAPGSQDAPIRIPLVASMPHTADFILLAGNVSSTSRAADLEDDFARYVPDVRVWAIKRIAGFFADSARSDHANYWDADLRAIWLTDTANFRSPHYHEPTDTLETLDLDFTTGIARAIAAWTLERSGAVR